MKTPSTETELISPSLTMGSVTDKISGVVLTTYTPVAWFAGAAVALGMLMMLFVAVTWLFIKGVGIWGINIPIGWGFAITNFVWWIGIGHAGTLISAILLLLHQTWRSSINRSAEAMTLFAVSCAGMFPILHLGRPWKFYYILPYPDTMRLWPQWRSPLVWDVFAVTTYATVSALFWYTGLVPDLAAMRDKAKHGVARIFYGMLAMGWRGSARHWQRYDSAYLLLAGLATPLVVSVHSVVSLDFSVAMLPGWHSTIFPPYFVAGAVYSGFAMVLSLLLPLRAVYHLEDLITPRHIDAMAKILLATGLMVTYAYLVELFMTWYSGNKFEAFLLLNRAGGPYAFLYWLMIVCNVVIPQALWSPRVRASIPLLFVISIVVNIGMWLERFIIIVVSLHRDFLSSSWGMYTPTVWDWVTLLGSMGLFLTMMALFVRLLPMISIFETRSLIAQRRRME